LRRATPFVMPVLSAGKHRNPRKGACFMEFASYLAGERWSDHPACTHPLLASLARQVNDALSDAGRAEIVELIPRVVGLTGSDPRIDVAIAIRAGATAMPIASQPRQNVIAAGLIACRAWMADAVLTARDTTARYQFVESLEGDAQDALVQTPHAYRWAEQFVDTVGISTRRMHTEGAPSIVKVSVEGVGQACVANPERILVQLLRDAITVCEVLGDRVTADTPQPAEGDAGVHALTAQ
jgi:hypothetical protein